MGEASGLTFITEYRGRRSGMSKRLRWLVLLRGLNHFDIGSALGASKSGLFHPASRLMDLEPGCLSSEHATIDPRITVRGHDENASDSENSATQMSKRDVLVISGTGPGDQCDFVGIPERLPQSGRRLVASIPKEDAAAHPIRLGDERDPSSAPRKW